MMITLLLVFILPLTVWSQDTSVVESTQDPVSRSEEVPVTTSATPRQINANDPAYWVIMNIRAYLNVNINLSSWRLEMELKLAKIILEAFQRRLAKVRGTWQPLVRRRRSLVFSRNKRTVTEQYITVQMVNATRPAGNAATIVELVYVVDDSGRDGLLPADEVVSLMGEFQNQEIAIMMGYYYDGSQIYNCARNPEVCNPTNNLWIIAAVLVPLVVLIFIIWCILFIYFKCCRNQPSSAQGKKAHQNSVIVNLSENGSLERLHTKTSDVEGPENTNKTEGEKPESEEELVATRSGREESNVHMSWSRRGSKVNPSPDLMPSNGSPLVPPLSDRERELLETKSDREHQKNLERLRRQHRENEKLTATLDDPNHIPPMFKVKKKRSRKSMKDGRYSPTNFNANRKLSSETEPDERTLFSERRKMNRILDSAFSLISPKERKQKRRAQKEEALSQSSTNGVMCSSDVIDSDGGVWMTSPNPTNDVIWSEDGVAMEVARIQHENRLPLPGRYHSDGSSLSRSAPPPYTPRPTLVGPMSKPHTIEVTPSHTETVDRDGKFDARYDDEVDVIRRSLRPGETPQALIKSIRDELHRYQDEPLNTQHTKYDTQR